MAEHDNGGGGGEVVDLPEDEGGPMEREIEDQAAAKTVGVEGATASCKWWRWQPRPRAGG